MQNALDFRSPTPEGVSREEHEYRRWRATPPTLEEVETFLHANPMVASFQWAALVVQGARDREDGQTDTEALYKIALHTQIRKRAYEAWKQRSINQPMWKFNKLFAKTAMNQLTRRGFVDRQNFVTTAIELGYSAKDADDMFKDFLDGETNRTPNTTPTPTATPPPERRRTLEPTPTPPQGPPTRQEESMEG